MSLIKWEEALRLLKRGEVVAVPTETVYGLAGRIDSEQTIQKIFQLKRRPLSDPLIVHFYNRKQMRPYIQEQIPFLKDLIDAFSPGPLTIIVKKTENISPLITSSKDSVAVRIPKHPLLRKILKEIEVPLAVPSANLFSQVSPTKSSHVLSSFSDSLSVLDGGVCDLGLESTLIKVDQEKKKIIILRPGCIKKEDIENFLNQKNISFSCEFQDLSLFPGGLKKHYAPSVPLVIVKSSKDSKEVIRLLLLKFPDKKIKMFSFQNSFKETAFHLYDQLRSLSEDKDHLICVQKIPNHPRETWRAIWNRLEKASSFSFDL